MQQLVHIPLAELTERYTACDPAGDRKELKIKKTASNSAYVTIATDSYARIFVLEDFSYRCSTNELVDRLYEQRTKWKSRVGVECAGQQQMFINMIRREAKLRGWDLPIDELKKPTTMDKDHFIRVHVQKALNEGRLFIQETAMELKSELASFPQNPKKDRLDALAHAIRMIPARRTQRARTYEQRDYERYLRDSGVAEHVIQEAMRGH